MAPTEKQTPIMEKVTKELQEDARITELLENDWDVVARYNGYDIAENETDGKKMENCKIFATPTTTLSKASVLLSTCNT